MKARWKELAAALVAAMAGMPAGAVPAAPAMPDRSGGELSVVLEGAVWHEGKAGEPKPLSLRLDHDGQAWRALAMGQSRAYNWGDHYGIVSAAKREADSLRLAVRMRIEPDPWTPTGGYGEYEIVLKAGEGGQGLRGTWTGTFRGQAAQGAAQGVWRAGDANWVPPASGEHPRMLLRRSDVAALRAKAKTGWGRQAMERLKAEDESKSSMAVGRGLLYVLTGEKAHADEARKLIERDIMDARWNWTTGPYHDPAVKAVEGSLAYDLVYETCDEGFRKRMAALFAQQVPYYYRGADQPLFNPNDGSNWSAMYRSGVGMCALSLLGEGGALPPRPMEPALARAEAPGDLAIGRGVPVVKLESGKLWSRWLFAGPVGVMPAVDALESLGGAAAARPEEGTRVKAPVDAWMPAGKGEVAFVPLEDKSVISPARAESIHHPEWAGATDVTAAMGCEGPGTCYLYCVVENAAPGTYRVEMLSKKMIAASVVIGGRRLANGDLVELGKGRLPVLAWLPVASKVGGFTNIEFFLKLHAVDANQTAAWLAEGKCRHAVDAALWEEAGNRRQAGGVTANPFAERWLGVGRQRIENWAVRALGEIGWNHEGEAYTQHSYRLVLPFAHAYRNVTGRQLAPTGQLNTCLLNYVGRTVIGTSAGRMQSFAPGGGPLGVDNWARGFGLLREEYRPYALWTWNRTQALADAGKLKLPEVPVDQLDPVSAAFRFVNYPLGTEEKDPVAIGERITVDRDRGGYVFRNRWRDDDDIAATVFLNSNCRGGGWGSSETGEFRISGLGAEWAVRGMGFGNGGAYRMVPNMRQAMNVLLPAEMVAQAGYEAVATHYASLPDGGGVLSLNMNDEYTASKPGPKGEAKAVPTRAGASAGHDVGIRGMRSFAADYSGQCGAPAMFVVADKVSGTSGKNVWQIVTEQADTVKTAEGTIKTGNTVKTGEGTFTITAPNGATLAGTVIWPAGAKVDTAAKTLRHEINYHGGHKRADFKRTVVNVHGGEFFLIVMTLQKGTAPGVEVRGKEQDAAASVGKRKVRFDGQKIVFGKE